MGRELESAFFMPHYASAAIDPSNPCGWQPMPRITPAIAFYLSQGFEFVGETYFRIEAEG